MSTVRQKWKYRVIAFGLDGTLLRGPNFDYSWQLVWREQKLPMKLHRQYMENFHDGKWDYTTWCQQVVKKLRSSGLTRDRIATIAAGVSLTKNFHQTVKTLKNEGFSLAIVSGGIDTFIHDAIPDAEKYFDYIFINRATFDSDFVGEGHNDVEAIKLAGLSIAYPPKDSKVYSHADVSIHDDDLSKILEHVLVLDDRAPVSPRQTTKAPATIPASDNSERRVTWLHLSDFRIALVHHPANWLKEYEDPNVWQFIERDFQFCLHGHEHQGWVKPIAGVGFTRIAAAATYENSKHENGYNFRNKPRRSVAGLTYRLQHHPSSSFLCDNETRSQ